MAGAFIVSRDTDDTRDIRFQTKENVSPVPKDQQKLKADIESALTVIRLVFSDDQQFENYFRPLLSLAQAGLAGEHADPEVAAGALVTLKNEITAREAGKIKNRYMKDLGKRAAAIGGPVLLLGIAMHLYIFARNRADWPNFVVLTNFFFIWAGCMAGVWLSFGARKTVLKFEDLHIPEEDRLEPTVRLLFAGLLTLIVGLLFSLKAVVINLGSISSDQINSNAKVALVVGLLGGFSEQALSSAVTKQASQFLNFGR